MKTAYLGLLLAFLLVSCGNQPPTATPAPGPRSTSVRPTATPLRQPTEATADCPLTAPPAPPVHNLQELAPGCDYAGWFETNTGQETDPAYFASYAFLPWDETIYLGFGAARPAETNGSLFAHFQNRALSAVYQPSEQGFIDMTPDWSQPLIHIPGPDPTDPAEPGGSQWDWGNTYVYDPTAETMTKHRNLPNVIHTWALDSTPAGLYAAVSSHLGDYETWTGEVFRSQDAGKSWERMANRDAGVGDYRTYDIIPFHDKLYVVWNDALDSPCGLAESADGGTTWTRLPEFSGYTNCRARLAIFNDQLIALSSLGDGILALAADGTVTVHVFPDFRAQDWVYNPFAVDAQNRLYLPTEDNRILRTSDLDSDAWETLVASDRDFITLRYWPERNRIAIGDRGSMGRVWLLAPDAAPVTPPDAPIPTITLDGDDVVLSWPDDPALSYRVYRSDQPDFTPPIQYLYDTPQQSPWRDAGVAAHPGAFFYEVRGKNSANDISAPSPTMGVFTYPLAPGMGM